MAVGHPTKSPHAPSPNIFLKHLPRWVAGAALVTASGLYFYLPATPTEKSLVNISTPGMDNVGKAYKRGGATSTHTPAYGGTKQGDESPALREGGATGAPNKTNALDKDGVGDDQRKPGTQAGQIFDQAVTGTHKGK